MPVSFCKDRFTSNRAAFESPSVHLQFDNTFGPPPSERPVFLVDDDPNDRELFLRALHDAGFPNSHRFFSTGDAMINALIAVLQGGPPPLACFLDVNMPGMNGMDVLRWIRLQDALAEIAVIMMSSSEDPRHVNEALRLGAQCYVKKLPHTAQIQEIMREAEKFSLVACGRSSFGLSCNLLVTGRQAA